MRSSFLAIAIGLSVAGFASNAFGADVTPEPEPVLLNDMYAEIFGSYTELGKDFGTEDDKFWAGGAGIYWSIPLSDMVSLQLDGKGEVTENDGEDEGHTNESVLQTVGVGSLFHISRRMIDA